jgi:cytoskeletal protein RodZ
MNQKKYEFTQSVGRTLQRRRRERKIRLSVVAAETNIPIQSLRILESNKYESLPHSIYTLGFVRRYAKFLGLSSATAARKYLLERGELPKPRQSLQRQNIKKPWVGSRAVIVSVAAILIVVVAAYVLWQLLVLAGPPSLSINQPPSNEIISSSSVEVRGQTTPGADVYINGQGVYVDDNGEFSGTVALQSGVNTLNVEARNKRDKVTKEERSVLVELPE